MLCSNDGRNQEASTKSHGKTNQNKAINKEKPCDISYSDERQHCRKGMYRLKALGEDNGIHPANYHNKCQWIDLVEFVHAVQYHPGQYTCDENEGCNVRQIFKDPVDDHGRKGNEVEIFPASFILFLVILKIMGICIIFMEPYSIPDTKNTEINFIYKNKHWPYHESNECTSSGTFSVRFCNCRIVTSCFTQNKIAISSMWNSIESERRHIQKVYKHE